MWGYDNNGSSGYNCDQIYRGSAAFSELETQTIRDFCLARDFVLALNYHTYSNLLIHPYVELNPGVINLGNLAARDTVNNTAAPLQLSLAPATPVGEKLVLNITLQDEDGFLTTDSIVMRAGRPDTLFAENGEEELLQWAPETNWGICDQHFSSEHGLTDSPGSDYSNNSVNALTLSQSLDLSQLSSACLRYMTRWDIEPGWDFGQVEISLDGDNSWQALRSPGMSAGTGSGVQNSNSYGYEGTHTEWREEIIYLDEYTGNDHVLLRFVLRTDTAVTHDGWYLDDIILWAYPRVSYLAGDVTLDGKIDVSDVVRTVNIILGLYKASAPETGAADIDGDGAIQVYDIVALVNLILNG